MCFGHSHPTDVYSLPDLPSLVLWCAETRTRWESDAQWCTFFGWKIWAPIFFLSKKLTTKKQTLMTNLQSFFNTSSVTSEARSNAAVSWLVAWKDPRSLRKGGLSKPACLFSLLQKENWQQRRGNWCQIWTLPLLLLARQRESHA